MCVQRSNPPGLPEPSGFTPRRRLRTGTRVLIGLGALLAVFGAVLAIELGTAERNPDSGGELLAAPSPILPARVSGYRIVPEPELADSLEGEYQSLSPSVLSVEAASVPLGTAAASVVAASLDATAKPSSSEFRAGVLTGAAGGFDIDPGANPFTYRTQGRVAVYATVAQQGRLFVWFFRDAFVQLFVPATLAAEADEIQRVILEAQLAQTQPAPSG